ncbi:MAG: carboxy-terminal protease [Symbiobacteriaceae bacterium]|nr:carboxy-terminal protease [Symbiobacteriaceae bacterium]
MQLIESLVKHLHEQYVDPEVAARIEAHIRPQMAEYAALESGEALSRRLTAELRSFDDALEVVYSAEAFPPQPEPKPPTPEQFKVMDLAIGLDNGGFHKVERLPGNVGYMEVKGFAPPEVAGETAAAAMAFLSGTEALIIDVRGNRGGAPTMVSMLVSYFVRFRTHLQDFRFRDRTDQFWTVSHVPGKRYLDKPVYVLTSRETFSAAEEFCYDLKTLKLATIVGEPTSGAKHPGRRFLLDDHYAVLIPGIRFVNPITGTNWEGTGVVPDIEAPAERALEAAYAAALRHVIARAEKESLDPWRRIQLEAEKALSELAQR